MFTVGEIPRHRTFISYHDGRLNPGHGGDHGYREHFERLFSTISEAFVLGSVRDGDIELGIPVERTRQLIRDKYLRDTTVTLVLVGARTWQRKHVDWEIGSSIRQTEHNARSGLMGIFLPTYPGRRDSQGVYRYNQYTIPPRLHDNVECGYAKLHPWTDDPAEVRGWIHEAFLRKERKDLNPHNTRAPFAQNRTGDRWMP